MPKKTEKASDLPKASVKAKRSSKEKKDPSAPKKPQSAYLIFMSDTRAELKEKHPEADAKELFRLGAALWKETTDRSQYEAKAKKDRDRYEKEMAEYNK